MLGVRFTDGGADSSALVEAPSALSKSSSSAEAMERESDEDNINHATTKI